jgi:hypothetical protein
MPVFQYVGAFYRLIHPDDEVDVGTLGIAFAGTGKTKIGFPNIANISSRVIWQAKTGNGVGQNIGSTEPGKTTISRGEKAAQRVVHSLNNLPGLYVPGWRVGNVSHPDPQENDIPLQIALSLCGNQCALDFANSTRIILWIPEYTRGVIAYMATGSIPDLKLGIDPIIKSITSIRGKNWRIVDFRQEVKKRLKVRQRLYFI